MKKLITGTLSSTSAQQAAPEAAAQAPASLTTPKAIINYIHRGPIDDKYNFRWQRRRLLNAASIREQISSVQGTFAEGSVHPVNDTITFPPIDVDQVLQTHEDTLILKYIYYLRIYIF